MALMDFDNYSFVNIVKQDTIKELFIMDILGTEVITKISSGETDGSYYVFDLIIPPGGGIPPHIHKYEDEMFCVYEGVLEIALADRTVKCAKGDVQNLPRGTQHGITNTGDTECRTFVMLTPGAGFEEFFSKLTKLSKGPDTDMAAVVALSAEYGITYV